MTKKIRVGVFFGGISPEHNVSLMSARGIVDNIDREKFKVVEVYISKDGLFYTGDNALKFVENKQESELARMDINKLSDYIDVAFPVLHGKGGEDGSIQGFFKTVNTPFVGCEIAASSVCLDKAYFNQLMEVNGIRQSRYVVIDFDYDNKEEINGKMKLVEKEFNLPLFVKSARTGSSVGVCKVNDWSDLTESINESRKFDEKIVIEEGVKDPQEIEVSVMGNSANDIEASLPGKVIPGAEFYDYEDKYFNNKASYEIPALLPEKIINEVQDLAVKIYKISNCCGLSRIDFLLDDKNSIFINEINTLPGFTPISMYPKLWEVSGLRYKNLITELVLLALRK